MDFVCIYDLFGVRIRLATDSARIRELAEFYLGAHRDDVAGRDDFLFEFRETTPPPEFDRPELQIGTEEEYRILECGDRIFFAAAEGVVCMDQTQRKAKGYVFPRDFNRVSPGVSVPLIQLLTLRTMFDAGFLPLHAAAVNCHGGMLIVAGEKGAGKSTLSLEFGRHGFLPACDDLVYLAQREGRLFAGGHRLPVKVLTAEVPRFASSLVEAPGRVRVRDKTVFPFCQVNPEARNQMQRIIGFVWLEDASTREASATVRWNCLPEVLFHLMGDSPMLNTSEHRARAFDWLSSADECRFLVARTSHDPCQTVKAILHALD